MARADLSFEAVTRSERIGTVDAINAAIAAADGWIDDFTLFSNISVAIRCVVPALKCAEFVADLRSIGLQFDTDARQAADAGRRAEADSLTVSINVTFVHDEPDLRRTIPSVPG